jgi:hypothetical protein
MNREFKYYWLKSLAEKFKICTLILLPIIFIYTAFISRGQISLFYSYCVDPAYAYLFNGLNLAHLKLPVHIDHPGTPLQIFSAIVIRIVHIFRPGNSLDSDVFTNPELYLDSIRISLYFLHATALFILGFFVYKSTWNILLSLFLQLTPFVSFSILSILNGIGIENMVLFSTLCFLLVVFLFLNKQDNENKIFDKYLILFSLIIGFGTASKITFAPMIFIPLFLLPGITKKAVFLILSIISFGIFAFPIFNQWVYFRDWIENLFIHSGQYGYGKANFIDTEQFISNLKIIFTTDTLFPIIYFIIIISCAIFNLPFIRKKSKNDKYHKALIGFSITMTIGIIMVAKQLKYQYLILVVLLCIPGIYLILQIFTGLIHLKIRQKYIYLLFSLFLVVLFQFEFKKVLKFRADIVNKKNNHTSLYLYYNYIESICRNSPTILMTYNYGAPLKEYGLYFGSVYCGIESRKLYRSILFKLYPQTYFYSFRHTFWNWDFFNDLTFFDLIKKHSKLKVLVGDPELESRFLSKVNGLNRQLDTKFDTLCYIKSTNEVLYEVKYDSSVTSITYKYSCDAEFLDNSKTYFINRLGQKFGNGSSRSGEVAKSGKYSSKLTKDTPYGMTCTISEVRQGEHYIIDVWRYNNNNLNAGLVVASADNKNYYTFNCKDKEKTGKWQKIQIDLIIPENLNNQNINIYCYNPDKNLPAYFDDLTIAKLSDK